MHARPSTHLRSLMTHRIGIDIGGTFTDLVVLDETGSVHRAKVLSTPENYGHGIARGLAAALAHEPHRIAFYLYEVASAFHTFWAKGKEDKALRFVNPEDLKLTAARLALVSAVRQVLVNGLTVLGVSAPDELS